MYVYQHILSILPLAYFSEASVMSWSYLPLFQITIQIRLWVLELSI